MGAGRPRQGCGNRVVATAWAAAVFAAAALIGLLLAPSMRIIWIVLLVLAVLAVPQAVLLDRRETRPSSRLPQNSRGPGRHGRS